MAELRAILYPVTYPKRHIRGHLSRFFKEIHVLLPSEKNVTGSVANGDNAGIAPVIAHVPVPLGDRREWFEAILKDWQQWASQIGLGREGTDAAVMEAASYAMEESLQSIVASIKGTEQDDEDLKARLFLELALELDMREDELSSDLHEVAFREKKLKDLLAGPAGPGRQKAQNNREAVAPLAQGKRRLRAWARLYAQWKDAPELCPVGEGINIKDEMDQAYESLRRQPAVEILSLDMSSPAPEDPTACDQARSIMMKLVKKIQKAECHGGHREDVEDLCRKIQVAWGGSEDAPGPRLVLTAYPGITWQGLLKAVARLDTSVETAEEACGYSFYLV